MTQRNDEEGGKQPRLSFSPADSVWGQMGRALTTDGRNAPRTTETMKEKDHVAFFHQFFGLTNNPALAPFTNVPCPCKRYFAQVQILLYCYAAHAQTSVRKQFPHL
jgi:hypothetical protein